MASAIPGETGGVTSFPHVSSDFADARAFGVSFA
jgi:hypothetical protein